MTHNGGKTPVKFIYVRVSDERVTDNHQSMMNGNKWRQKYSRKGIYTSYILRPIVNREKILRDTGRG